MAQATLILHGRGYMGKGRSIVVLHLLAICQESIIHWHQPKKYDSQQLSVQSKSHPIFVTIDALHCIFVLSLTFFVSKVWFNLSILMVSGRAHHWDFYNASWLYHYRNKHFVKTRKRSILFLLSFSWSKAFSVFVVPTSLFGPTKRQDSLQYLIKE